MVISINVLGGLALISKLQAGTALPLRIKQKDWYCE